MSDTEPAPADRAVLARRMIGLIDLTDLDDDHAADGIDTLCARAAEHVTAAVCVWPEFVAPCASALRGTGVRVATVVNFPGGDEPLGAVVRATGAALADGADDIDVVLPYRSLLAGDRDGPGRLLADVASLVDGDRILKVILETGALGGVDQVADAAQLAVDHGADFVKTSTGKIPIGATLDAAAAMLGVIERAARDGRTVGLKPSGGIRTFDEARAYVDLAESVMGARWATPATFRFGASGLLDALLAEIDPATPPPPTSARY